MHVTYGILLQYIRVGKEEAGIKIHNRYIYYTYYYAICSTMRYRVPKEATARSSAIHMLPPTTTHQAAIHNMVRSCMPDTTDANQGA